MMDKDSLTQLIISISKQCGVDPELSLAISEVESGNVTEKVRFEPGYKWTLNTNQYAKSLGITEQTEVVLQSMSWSCLQVMGSTARELGYSNMLTLLVNPELGVLYACKYLKMLIKKYQNKLDAISSYNQGAPYKLNGVYKNKDYVNNVMSHIKKRG